MQAKVIQVWKLKTKAVHLTEFVDAQTQSGGNASDGPGFASVL